MKLGVYLHTTSPFYPKTNIEEYVDQAKYFEEAGADSLWFADHLIRTPDPNESEVFETWTLISGLARETESIKFGTMVSPATFRNVGLFANMITTVDHLSNGRVIAGLGAGWYDKEHEMFDIPLNSVRDRMKRFEEYIINLKTLWTEDYISFDGEFITLDEAYLNPKPIQDPHPPILIGGGGEKKTLKYVAKYAKMSNFGGTPDTIKHKLQVLKDHCDDVGRSFDEIEPTTNRAIILGNDHEEVDESVEAYRNRLLEMGREPPSKEDFDKKRLVGTLDEVESQIGQIEDLGIDLINLTVNDKRTTELLPQLISKY